VESRFPHPFPRCRTPPAGGLAGDPPVLRCAVSLGVPWSSVVNAWTEPEEPGGSWARARGVPGEKVVGGP